MRTVALAEKRIEVKQTFVLIQRVTVGHAGDEVTDLTGKAASVIGEGTFPPVGRQQAGIAL